MSISIHLTLFEVNQAPPDPNYYRIHNLSTQFTIRISAFYTESMDRLPIWSAPIVTGELAFDDLPDNLDGNSIDEFIRELCAYANLNDLINLRERQIMDGSVLEWDGTVLTVIPCRGGKLRAPCSRETLEELKEEYVELIRRFIQDWFGVSDTTTK